MLNSYVELICLAAYTTHLNTTKVVVSYPLFDWWVHPTPRASSSLCLRIWTWNSYTSIQLRRSLPSNTTEAWNLASENQEGCRWEDNKWRRKSSFIHITMAPLAPIMLGESNVAKLTLPWSVLFHSTSWTQWMDTSLRWNLCNQLGGTWNARED